MTNVNKAATSRLRRGRFSQIGQVYLVTTVTRDRQPVFTDFAAARSLIGILRAESAIRSCSTLAFVVMPDHLHWLLQLQEGALSTLVGRVKSLSARRLGSPVWQAGFHDRTVRREEDLASIARYVIANPLRAGLVERIGLYPHWDATWLK